MEKSNTEPEKQNVNELQHITGTTQNGNQTKSKLESTFQV
jgi:hypothetical protein